MTDFAGPNTTVRCSGVLSGACFIEAAPDFQCSCSCSCKLAMHDVCGNHDGDGGLLCAKCFKEECGRDECTICFIQSNYVLYVAFNYFLTN